MPPQVPLEPGNILQPGVFRNAFIPPRQPGESAYAYRNRRTLAQYGQTAYQRRIFLAAQKGQGRAQARGHGGQGGETESQRRRRLSIEQTGLTPSQLRRSEIVAWLTAHGYTPGATGMTWTQLIRVGVRLRWMYDATGPNGRVTPAMIAEAVSLEQTNTLAKGWAFERLWRKYEDMQAYRAYRDRMPGRESWTEYVAVHDFVPSLAIQWWFYH